MQQSEVLICFFGVFVYVCSPQAETRPLLFTIGGDMDGFPKALLPHVEGSLYFPLKPRKN